MVPKCLPAASTGAQLEADDLLQCWRKELAVLDSSEIFSDEVPSAIFSSGIFNTGDLYLK